MRPLLSNHAIEQMADREITIEDVIAVLESPENVTMGETAIEYDATVSGRLLRVVVVRDSEPPLVITVFDRYR